MTAVESLASSEIASGLAFACVGCQSGSRAERFRSGAGVGLEFVEAEIGRDHELLMRLNVDYLSWIGEEIEKWFGLSLPPLLGASIPDYVEGALEKLCASAPPEGVFYIVRDDGVVVGMGGLRHVRDGVGEVKRIYVLRTARGGGVGARLLERLMSDARAFGYRELLLESAPFMKSAHKIYEAAGFTDIAAYAEAEVPEALRHDWRFMRCKV
jgi:GNAT superfamily N-acetyltransferase